MGSKGGPFAEVREQDKGVKRSFARRDDKG